MENREEQLIRSLMETDSELRSHYHEHLELKRRSEELQHQQFLTENEEIELKRIQKQKLAGKDKMMEILSRHRQPAA